MIVPRWDMEYYRAEDMMFKCTDGPYVLATDVVALIQEFIDDDTLNHWPPQTTLERLLGEFE